MADPREEAIRRHYDRRSQPQSFLDQKAASSRPGQVYHTMTSLQDRMGRPGYQNTRADIDQLKGLRRDWNRNQKYTPQGMRISGATSPLDAQNRFSSTTENFRQANPRAYGTMYPLSQAAMKLGESGGLLGLGVKAFTGKLGDWKKGITSMIDSDKEEQDEYVAKTFGYYPTDIHSELPIDEESGLTREEEIEKLLVDPGVKSDSELILEKLRDELTPQKTEEELRREQLLKEAEENIGWSNVPEDVEPLPFDEGREDYIAELGMNPNLLRREKLESMHPEDQRLFEHMAPHLDREIPANIGVEFEGQDEIPPINYGYDPRTESGIANLMPGGPLYDRVPMAQRLRLMDTAKRLKEGPHRGMPLSYHGRNWYDEYKRKLENELEVNRGIRAPMDR